MLLQAGADIEAKDQHGWTVLMHACTNGHYNVVEMLLQAGAYIKAKIKAGADIEAKNQYGWTVMCACYNVVEMLLQAGADIEAKALRFACGAGYSTTVETLL
eukprot:gene19953-7061_t